MALDAKKFTIQIESIFGGQSQFQNFGATDQFIESVAIDPDLPSGNFVGTSGYIVPAQNSVIDGSTTLSGTPRWFVTTPKDQTVYTYDSVGSIYTGTTSATFTGLGDLNDGGTSGGNGAAYYDNYVYFARATTVARYGPLDGSPAFIDDYWTTTLGKVALTDTTYPNITAPVLPNHVMYRHNDGKLYFGDVVGNQGVLHCISTTKATVEGDTDNGSTFNAVDFPYGMWPTAMDGYGDLIAIALYEGSNSNTVFQSKAKLVFWDPTNPTTYDKLINIEFPDPIIVAVKNANGVLYIISGQIGQNTQGVRITRYLGGNSFEQVAYLDNATLPHPGAVDSLLNRLVWGGGYTNSSTTYAAVWALGTRKGSISNNLFNIMAPAGKSASNTIALKYVDGSNGLSFMPLLAGWRGNATNRISTQFLTYGYSKFDSQLFRIGKRFKLTSISFYLEQNTVGSGGTGLQMNFVVDGTTTPIGPLIDNITYPTGAQRFYLRPQNLTGNHSFYVEGVWNTTTATIALPITIEGEYIDD